MSQPKLDVAQLVSMLGDWRQADMALPDQLATAIADIITAGFIPAGMTLPPQRQMAQHLGISRSTVIGAYAALEGLGHVVSHRGSGTHVRSARTGDAADGRLFSFSQHSRHTIDLSTGALPASQVTKTLLENVELSEMHDYLDTDGYFPAGLPILRHGIAAALSHDGIPTSPKQILVTSGAQHATSLVLRHIVGAGDTVLVEDPTYRGALEVLSGLGARTRTLPMRRNGIDLDLLESALNDSPRAAYLQTSIHNPTGITYSSTVRQEAAALLSRRSTIAIEDCCSHDLTLHTTTPAPTLAGQMDDDLLISIGTLSKQFWGGLRVGWVRSSQMRIRSLVELRKGDDLSSSVADQLWATRLLPRLHEARSERRAMLASRYRSTTSLLADLVPTWSWTTPHGGTGLWVDTGCDASILESRGTRVGVRLSPGAHFSAVGGHRHHLRLPLWHDHDQVRDALERLMPSIQAPE